MPGYLAARSPFYLSELLHDGTYYSYFFFSYWPPSYIYYLRSGPLPFLRILVHAWRLARLVYSDGYWTVERARDGTGCLTELAITQLWSMKTLSDSMSR
ncbi:hypothetical protein CY34DRAFT_523891 [Suillus luteus UH-Slu-Lm8-n1]|uniref:Uncharacterized protein n=1 Tax=Suillus luteus UH-Slu-Lm8-n1 TaxID=930992 RepID=A0A0D0B6Y7_9AGAM|nr:hypothetical protein CY34DRAFT_523891 [Suillus luteus UH-Slu-Lm8-n1]